jgi:hypothetical protein
MRYPMTRECNRPVQPFFFYTYASKGGRSLEVAVDDALAVDVLHPPCNAFQSGQNQVLQAAGAGLNRVGRDNQSRQAITQQHSRLSPSCPCCCTVLTK